MARQTGTAIKSAPDTQLSHGGVAECAAEKLRYNRPDIGAH